MALPARSVPGGPAIPGEVMNRRFFLLAAASIAMQLPGAADAAGTDAIVSQLGEQGYRRITVSRTLLGRVRILATAPGRRREIILNPRTGELLRDYMQSSDDDDARDLIGDGSGRGRGRGGDDDGDDRDDSDDREDREDRDDRDDRDERDDGDSSGPGSDGSDGDDD